MGSQEMGSMSGSRAGPIECARCELFFRSDEVAAAEQREHAEERARVLLLLVDRAAWNALAITFAIGLQGRRIDRSHQRRDAVPFSIGGREDFLPLAGDLDEAGDRVAVPCRPAAIED